jgi:hypothetical protein
MACCPRGEKEREPNGLPCFAHSRRSQFHEQQASVEHLCENVKAATVALPEEVFAELQALGA